MTATLTQRQIEAQSMLSGTATHEMLFGGSRSGKTFLLVRNVVMRALKSAESRHVIFRFRFNAVKSSVMLDTFPKVMRIMFAGVSYQVNKTDSYATFQNGSEIWFAGLDDKERVEKILGMEFATIYLNECSQISLSSRNMAVTRLAQKVNQSITDRQTKEVKIKPLKTRFFYDCNPPSKGHWTYLLFIKKVDPETKLPMDAKQAADYAHFKINPHDNIQNLSDGYLETLQGMSARMRKRFLDGEFADATPNALFSDELIEQYRHISGELPQLIRVVVAVDPSGCGEADNADNDAIGIVVVGLGIDGIAYILEDCTVKAAPAVWGRVVTDAYDRHQADIVVAEINYGGAMVENVIQAARPRTPYKTLTASRGKAVRAEPISALYEQGKVRHVGIFRELEDELTCFSTVGYLGDSSPNRADALVWGISELFSGIVSPRKPKKLTSNNTNWRVA